MVTELNKISRCVRVITRAALGPDKFATANVQTRPSLHQVLPSPSGTCTRRFGHPTFLRRRARDGGQKRSQRSSYETHILEFAPCNADIDCAVHRANGANARIEPDGRAVGPVRNASCILGRIHRRHILDAPLRARDVNLRHSPPQRSLTFGVTQAQSK
ncbi:hypothetical protein A0H81_04094 [Grifola frondosa]|uniref:Uncharacterized protein n=1 Tax=Grifola frondosa TaxID=5627 RepID=A0A1C7MEG2_GRIFR|nr:hypothetical protein A0H81_04094 [Grifola frondosa]